MSSNGTNGKRVLISFLGNINYDTRARNLYFSLLELGYEVDTLSFDWYDRPQGGPVSVTKLSKAGSSLFFYLKFALAVKLKLIFNKYDLYIASDIYNLPFLSFFAKFRSKPLFYDSRELFKYLAGLKDKQKVQSLLAAVEKSFIKDCDRIIVTGMMDAEVLMEDYRLTPEKFILLRNLPHKVKTITPLNLRAKYGFPEGSLVLIYQGVILKGRGLSVLFQVLKKLEHCCLVIMGDGDMRGELEMMVERVNLKTRVVFTGTIPQNEILSYTAAADIGCTLIEKISKSYYYALPNKMFEYIAAGIPVLASNLPQMMQIIDKYGVGKYADPEDIDAVVGAIMELSDSASRAIISENARKAHQELNWEAEFERVKHHFN